MIRRIHRQGGFTLIELLVVLSVIVIVAAILFPVFGAAREKARQVTCISNISQLGKATQLYAHLDGDSWDYLLIAPVTTPDQEARFDQVAARKGVKTGFGASLQFRDFLTYHSDTLVSGPVSTTSPSRSSTTLPAAPSWPSSDTCRMPPSMTVVPV